MTFRVEFTDAGTEQAEGAATWWRVNRPAAPELAEVHVVSNPVARRGDHEHGPSRTQLTVRGRTPTDGRDGPGSSDSKAQDHDHPDHPDRQGDGGPDTGEPGRPA